MTLVAVAYLTMTDHLKLESHATSAKSQSCNAFPWFALQVRTRQEASVAQQLNGQGYERFLPLYKVRESAGPTESRKSTLRCFPGYLFCRFNPQDRLPILKTPGVIQIVGFKNGPAAVDEAEIRVHTNTGHSGCAASAVAILGGGRSRQNRIRSFAWAGRNLDDVKAQSSPGSIGHAATALRGSRNRFSPSHSH